MLTSDERNCFRVPVRHCQDARWGVSRVWGVVIQDWTAIRCPACYKEKATEACRNRQGWQIKTKSTYDHPACSEAVRVGNQWWLAGCMRLFSMSVC